MDIPRARCCRRGIRGDDARRTTALVKIIRKSPFSLRIRQIAKKVDFKQFVSLAPMRRLFRKKAVKLFSSFQ
jgi:hypothetical protein